MTARTSSGRSQGPLLERHYKLGGRDVVQTRGRAYFRRFARFSGRHDQEPPLLEQEIADRIVQLPRIKFGNPQFTLTTTFNREDFTRLLVERFGLTRRRSRRSLTKRAIRRITTTNEDDS